MPDIAGVSLPYTSPVNNSGVNPQRDIESQNTGEQLNATTTPQQSRPLNTESTDVAADQSISARLDISVPNTDNPTQENTTVTQDQVVQALEQQLQQNNVNQAGNEAVTTDQVQTQIEQTSSDAAQASANQTNNESQASDDVQANTNTQPSNEQAAAPATNEQPDDAEVSVAANTAPDQASQPIEAPDSAAASTATPDSAPEDTTVQATNNTDADTQNQNDTEQPTAESGLGLEPGSIIDTAV